MEDKVEKSLANYDLTVKRRYRHRGGWLLETTQGPKLLREYEQIRGHFAFENKIKEILVLRGFERVDKALKNNADEYVTELESGEKYVIYQWFSVTPVKSGEFPVKAKRPKNSRMSKEKLVANGFSLLPAWQDAVARYINLL